MNTLDLMTFLENQYAKHIEALYEQSEEDHPDTHTSNKISPFIDFCRTYLNNNAVVNIVYLQVGLGLKLAQGQVVTLTSQSKDSNPMNSAAIPVMTTSAYIPPTDLLPDNSINAIGGLN